MESSTCSSTFDADPRSNKVPMSAPSSVKRKRNQPGNPNPNAEVIALSPKTLMATNRFVCEVCNKGFQREQNLQLHRRGHNLPWKLKQKDDGGSKELIRKKVYLCPEPTCVHHDPTRALGDLTGIKKHYSRKHGEKKHRCEKCSKRYAVHSDWKAHSKACGTREYRCDCGTLFSRRDSFITHRAFCDALAEESARNLNHAHLDDGNGVDGAGASHHHLHLLGGLMTAGIQDQNLSFSSNGFFRYAGGTHLDNLIGSASSRAPPSLQKHSNEESYQPSLHSLMLLQQQQPPQLHGNGSSSSLLNLGFFPGESGGAGEDPSIFTYGTGSGSMHIPNPAYISAASLLQRSAMYGSITTENGGSSSQLELGSTEEHQDLKALLVFERNNNSSDVQEMANSIAHSSTSVLVPGVYHHHHRHQEMDQYAAAGFHPHGMELGEDGKLTRDFLGVGRQWKRRKTTEDHLENPISQTSQGGTFNSTDNPEPNS